MMQGRGLVVLLLLSLSAGCLSGGGSAKPTTTVPSTTTTTDPYAIPATIDVAYVQRVMDAIDVLLGKAAQALVRERSVDGEWAKYARAALDDRGLAAARKGAELELGLNLRDYRPSPGQPHTTVRSVVIARTQCVAARALIDGSEVVTLASAISESHIEFSAKDPGRDPGGLNPSPWLLARVSDVGAKVELCGA
jgi:hypothetical protein